MYAIMMVKCLFFLLLFSLLIKCTHQESLCDIVPGLVSDEIQSGLTSNECHKPSFITFNCTLNPVNGYTSSDIVFLYTDGKGEFKEVDSSQVRLVDKFTAQMELSGARIGNYGGVICEARNGDQRSSNETVCESNFPRTKIFVGPREDWLVKDLTCKYLYLREMSCFWSEQENNVQTRISEYPFGSWTGASYQFSKANPCPRMIILGQLNSVFSLKCTWKGSTFSKLPFNKQYVFGLRYTSSLGEFLYQEFRQLAMVSIVQLGPPTNLRFTSEEATLSWDYPELYPVDLLPFFVFRVWVTRLQPLSLEEESTELILFSKRISWKLEQLKPDCEYNFNVSIKVDDGKNPYWSEPASLPWRTKKVNPVPVLVNERVMFPLVATCMAGLTFLGLAVLVAMAAYCRFTHSPTHVIAFRNKALFDPHEQL